MNFASVFAVLLWRAKAVLIVLLALILVGAWLLSVGGYSGKSPTAETTSSSELRNQSADVVRHEWRGACYLAFITALTIGYGDSAPIGLLSKTTAIGLGFIGIVLVGVIVAAAIEALKRTA